MDGKVLARHKETSWWNDIRNSISEKHKLWKNWKQGQTREENYREVKKKARGAVYLNIKQKGRNLEKLCGRMIRRVMYLRLQRRR